MKQEVYSLELNKWCIMYSNKISACKYAQKTNGKVFKLLDKYAVVRKELA